MIVKIAEAMGGDAKALSEVAGFDPAGATDPDARIPIGIENALWDAAAEQLRDPSFGLRAATLLRPGMFDVLDYVVRTAPTVRAALDRLVRYNRLVHSAAVFDVEDQPDRVRIEHAFAVPLHRPSRHASEFTLASLVMIGGQISGRPLVPIAVELPHERGADLGVYVEIFGIRPRFESPVGAIELARDDAERACPAADPLLSEVILRQANALLAALPDPESTFAARVRRKIVEHLAEGAVSLAAIARSLRMSERSLQRRLADEGVAFDALLDSLRHELALRYLAKQATAIGEVAYLLGYSEPSAFHRAFKRWTGKTPAEARVRAA